MKRLSVLIGGLVMIALPAMAKGPVSATVDGPGIDESIVVDWQPGSGLDELVESIGYWSVVWSSSGDQSRVSANAPIEELGDAYEVGVTVIGPGGDAYFPVTVYPHADGGALVFAEGGVHVEEMQSETSGGWYRASHDVVGIFESLGVVWPTVHEVTVVDQPESPPIEAGPFDPAEVEGSAVLPALAAATGVMILAAFWVMWRRPRRLEAS